VFAGGQLLFAGVSNRKIISFSGQPKSAYVVTGDIDAGRSLITLAKPIVDNGSATVAVASRQLLSGSITFGTPVAADAENRCSLRSSGNYHRIKVAPTGSSWDTLVGVNVDIQGQGSR
jgi:hypothetical protein